MFVDDNTYIWKTHTHAYTHVTTVHIRSVRTTNMLLSERNMYVNTHKQTLIYTYVSTHIHTHSIRGKKTRSRDSLSDTRWTHEHNVLIIKFAHILYPHEMKRITKMLTLIHTNTAMHTYGYGILYTKTFIIHLYTCTEKYFM